MGKIKTVLLFGMLSVCGFTSCTNSGDFEKGKKQLEQQGYINIEDTGHSYFCCDEKDVYSSGFKCLNSKGETVTGCFCSGHLKGVTIRFN